jgi:hypothetical protein
MLLGPPLAGNFGAEKLDLSDDAYGGRGLAAIGVLSAFGPVGMLAGKLFGDVLTAKAPPLPPRGPNGGEAALGDASRGLYCGRVALETDVDTFARSAA